MKTKFIVVFSTLLISFNGFAGNETEFTPQEWQQILEAREKRYAEENGFEGKFCRLFNHVIYGEWIGPVIAHFSGEKEKEVKHTYYDYEDTQDRYAD